MEGIVVIDLVYGRGVDLVFCLFLMFVLHSDGSLLFLLLYIILSFLWKERGGSCSFLYLYFYLSFFENIIALELFGIEHQPIYHMSIIMYIQPYCAEM